MTKAYLAHCLPCNCGGPCVHTDDFTADNLDWEEADTSGGTAVEYTHDAVNGWMDATGDGSLTMITTGEFTSIYVAATLIDNGTQTESGVTIRRADSDSNISLVRVWDTTDAYELRQGTTVLEAFTATGDTIIKLEIVDAVSGTADINCYVGGVLVHTESGVSFTTPDVLNLGIICKGGGKWDSVEMSPCPCPTTRSCSGLTVPITWTMEGVVVTPSPGGGCPGFSGDYTFIARDLATAILTGDSPVDPNVKGTWGTCSPNPSADSCEWYAVYTRRHIDSNDEWISELPPDGCWPREFTNWNSQTFQHDSFLGPLAFVGYWRVLIEQKTEIGVEHRVVLEAVEHVGDTHALYYSDWFPSSHDFTVDAVTVVLSESTGCTYPGAIDLTPNGLREFAKGAAGCISLFCPPSLEPGKLYTLTDDLGGCTVSSGVFNEATFSWEWTWNMSIQYNEPETPPHGCSNPLSYQAKLTCYEKNEGDGKKWHVDFTGDITGSIEWDVINNDAGGLVDICGTADVAFAALASECVPEEHPLAGCVDESLKSALCCLEGLIVDSDYTLVDPSTQPPECGVNDRLVAGFDGTGWLSPHPNEGARADGVEVRLTCSGGSVSVTEIVGGVETNCFISEQSQNPFVVKASGNHVGRCGSSPGTIWTLS